MAASLVPAEDFDIHAYYASSHQRAASMTENASLQAPSSYHRRTSSSNSSMVFSKEALWSCDPSRNRDSDILGMMSGPRVIHPKRRQVSAAEEELEREVEEMRLEVQRRLALKKESMNGSTWGRTSPMVIIDPPETQEKPVEPVRKKFFTKSHKSKKPSLSSAMSFFKSVSPEPEFVPSRSVSRARVLVDPNPDEEPEPVSPFSPAFDEMDFGALVAGPYMVPMSKSMKASQKAKKQASTNIDSDLGAIAVGSTMVSLGRPKNLPKNPALPLRAISPSPRILPMVLDIRPQPPTPPADAPLPISPPQTSPPPVTNASALQRPIIPAPLNLQTPSHRPSRHSRHATLVALPPPKRGSSSRTPNHKLGNSTPPSSGTPVYRSEAIQRPITRHVPNAPSSSSSFWADPASDRDSIRSGVSTPSTASTLVEHLADDEVIITALTQRHRRYESTSSDVPPRLPTPPNSPLSASWLSEQNPLLAAFATTPTAFTITSRDQTPPVTATSSASQRPHTPPERSFLNWSPEPSPTFSPNARNICLTKPRLTVTATTSRLSFAESCSTPQAPSPASTFVSEHRQPGPSRLAQRIPASLTIVPPPTHSTVRGITVVADEQPTSESEVKRRAQLPILTLPGRQRLGSISDCGTITGETSEWVEDSDSDSDDGDDKSKKDEEEWLETPTTTPQNALTSRWSATTYEESSAYNSASTEASSASLPFSLNSNSSFFSADLNSVHAYPSSIEDNDSDWEYSPSLLPPLRTMRSMSPIGGRVSTYSSTSASSVAASRATRSSYAHSSFYSSLRRGSTFSSFSQTLPAAHHSAPIGKTTAQKRQSANKRQGGDWGNQQTIQKLSMVR